MNRSSKTRQQLLLDLQSKLLPVLEMARKQPEIRFDTQRL
jgi:hypothetical protein